MDKGRDPNLQSSQMQFKPPTSNPVRREVIGKNQRKYSDKQSNSISTMPAINNTQPYIYSNPMSYSANLTSSATPNGKFTCCPSCNYRFWISSEELSPPMKNYDSRSSNVEQEDCNISDKIKSHSLLIKSSFKTEPLSPYCILRDTQSSSFQEEGVNDLLLNLADQKSKLAEALNNNDEFLHKIQKRDNDLKILSQKLFQKDEKINSLQNEIYLLNQENVTNKTMIQEINQSNQNLIKQLNTLTRIKLLAKS
jgi:hypothetical protein